MSEGSMSEALRHGPVCGDKVSPCPFLATPDFVVFRFFALQVVAKFNSSSWRRTSTLPGLHLIMNPRLGLPADVEAVTKVIIEAMPLDPQWDFRFPYRYQYPADHYKYTRMLFEYFLDPSYDD
jgi:hypothetical protein